jgi:hypothetical protein
MPFNVMRTFSLVTIIAATAFAAPLPQSPGNDQLLGTVNVPAQNSGGLVGALGT